MCLGPEALFLLGTAATVGGTVANASANRKVAKERNARTSAENVRQKKLGDENKALVDQTLSGLTAEQQTLANQNAIAAREKAITPPAAAAPVMYDTGTAAAPKEVKSEMAAQLADAIRKGRSQIKSLATLQGQGDANLNQGMKLNRALTQGGMIRGFQEGSSNVLPYELAEANDVGNGRRMTGDVLSSLGSIAQLYSMTRPPVKTPVPIETRTLKPRGAAALVY